MRVLMSARGRVLSLLLGALSVPGMALSQDAEDSNLVDEDGKKVLYKATTEISFEGIDVEGEIKKPVGSLLLDRKKSKFSPLIKFREDFNPEMVQSVNEIK